MSKDKKQPDEDAEKVEIPAFTEKSMCAFITLLLWKIGGMECITQEQLDKFNIEDGPELLYSHQKKAWTMKLKDDAMPTIVTVPKKMLKRNRKLILS